MAASLAPSAIPFVAEGVTPFALSALKYGLFALLVLFLWRSMRWAVRGLSVEAAPARGGRAARAPRPGAASRLRPRTAQRIDRHRNRTSRANRPYFSADRANGVTPSATKGMAGGARLAVTVTSSGTPAPWCRS